MKHFILSTVAVISVFAFVSCERHSWEDSAEGAKDGTKNLFPKEDPKGHKGDHAKDDAGHGDHGAHDGHDH